MRTRSEVGRAILGGSLAVLVEESAPAFLPLFPHKWLVTPTSFRTGPLGSAVVAAEKLTEKSDKMRSQLAGSSVQ